MVELHEAAERIVTHEAAQVTLKQFVGDEIFIGHAVVVLLVVDEQQTEHLIHLLIAEEIVVAFDADVTQTTVFRVGVDSCTVVEETLLALGPLAIEQTALKHAQVFGCHAIVAVDDFALGDAACQASALAIVRDGFLSFKGVALGIVDHTELIEHLGGGQRGGHVAGECGKEAFCAVLVELKETVAELSLHGQSKVDTTDAHRRRGLVFLCFLDNALPLMGAN